MLATLEDYAFDKFVQFSNTASPILVILSGIIISFKLTHPVNI